MLLNKLADLIINLQMLSIIKDFTWFLLENTDVGA